MLALVEFACRTKAMGNNMDEGHIQEHTHHLLHAARTSHAHNCSISGKKEYVPPLDMADANTARPSEDENEIEVVGSSLR